MKDDYSRDESRPRNVIMVVAAVIIFHIAAIMWFMVHYRKPNHALIPAKTEKSDIPVLSRKGGPQPCPKKKVSAPNGKISPPSIDNSPNFYSWKDSEGVQHYSDSPPNEIVSSFKKIPKIVPKENEVPTLSGQLSPSAKISNYTHIAIINNNIHVPVRFRHAGRTVETYLILDTGASRTSLHRGLANRLKLRKKLTSTVIVADGRSVSADIANVDFIEVGPYRLASLEVSVIAYHSATQNYEGLLGMDFLKQVDYYVDFPSRIIHWSLPER